MMAVVPSLPVGVSLRYASLTDNAPGTLPVEAEDWRPEFDAAEPLSNPASRGRQIKLRTGNIGEDASRKVSGAGHADSKLSHHGRSGDVSRIGGDAGIAHRSEPPRGEGREADAWHQDLSGNSTAPLRIVPIQLELIAGRHHDG